ncbi:MAG: 4-(cytidine 5'-diphospho)-2-C-methyl-D-erythritol kinase [Clostridia bacterium]|nr:4-(cytidine 5'-diphospho)-2-C-methyl-D-erythritol kinase [Clostridia bacterium]
MIVDVPAKINWTLQICGKRADGYHTLDSIMQHISLYDTLNIEPAAALSLTVISDDGAVPTDEKNLVLRAAEALRRGGDQGASITLTKRIPTGAGLGGGSADAAAALLALNALWGLRLPIQTLESLGCSLGADIPFCLHSQPMRVGGIGEILTPLDKPVPAMHLVLLKGSESLSTKTIYECFDEQPPITNGKTYADEWLGWIHSLHADGQPITPAWNDLEPVSIRFAPAIQKAKDALYENGAVFAQMTGSGTAVFGVFADEKKAARCAASLKESYPVCLLCQTL